MHRTTLLTTIAIAVAGIICYSSTVHAASVSVDALKAQFLPAEFRNKNFTMEDAKRVFREKCKKASGIDNSTLYQDVEKGVANLTACLSSVANMTAIQEEIEQARPIGELDTVFHKYCTKVPVVEDCLKTFNAKIQPCLTEEEKKQNAIMSRLATNLMGFMCAKGGDQIALFVAEDGPECFEANKEAITSCANSSFAEFAPKDGSVPDIFNLPELVLKPEHCVDLATFEACTLHHLQQCQEITPANVAESVFKFVKNETSCTNWIDKKSNERSILKKDGDDGALSTASSSFLLLGAFLFLLICNKKLF